MRHNLQPSMPRKRWRARADELVGRVVVFAVMLWVVALLILSVAGSDRLASPAASFSPRAAPPTPRSVEVAPVSSAQVAALLQERAALMKYLGRTVAPVNQQQIDQLLRQAGRYRRR